jgi:WD40 repeat protein
MKLARCLPILILTAICCLRPTQSSEKSAKDTDAQHLLYESWIHDYRAGPLRGALGIEQREIKLVITVVESDDLETDPQTGAIFGPSIRTSFYGCAVSIDGTISYFQRSPGGAKGSGVTTLPKDEFERLNELVGQLPEDNSKLPPIGHRIVLQVTVGSGVLARVYDRANAPETVLEILRLSHSGIRPLTLDFPPQKKWPLSELSQTGTPENAIRFRGPDMEETTILAISPDGYLTVRQVLHDTPAVTITDSNPSNVIHTLRVPQPGNRFVGITDAQFTPDAHYLMLLTTLPAIRIYDTKDWQEVGSLPDLPAKASLYYPSSDWKYGIAVYANGDVALWDTQSRRQVAKINTGGGVPAVSFSPDDSMVATTSSHENRDHSSTLHLRVWNVLSGEMVAELRPFEQITNGDIGAPIWWPDGRYLLATVRDNPFGSNHDIGIWGVQSGRFRGEFSGCVYSADPLSIVLHEAKLFERCRDGMIFMWDAGAAISKIAAYENSITQGAESK